MWRGVAIGVAAMLWLSGCSYYWRLSGDDFEHSNVPLARFARDETDCRSVAVEREGYVDVNDYLLVYNKVFAQCMKARGYRREDSDTLGVF